MRVASNRIRDTLSGHDRGPAPLRRARAGSALIERGATRDPGLVGVAREQASQDGPRLLQGTLDGV